jgi:hypothetical protein
MLPDPILTEHDGFLVLRDDLLAGGTKRRAIHALFDSHDEFVYPSPVFGYAQLALAYAAREAGKKATVFCAKRKERHPRTREAEEAGAQIIEVPNGYLNVVKARAREYCAIHEACLLPFGLDTPAFINALADVARALPILPTEVWSVVGSGALSRALQLAWPKATFYGIQVGSVPNAGGAHIMAALEPYEKDARYPPPFPSCSNYDAKVWYFMRKHGSLGALMWNVGA